jgi:beta-glucanase (GH16 family)
MLWETDKVTWCFDGQPLHSESAYPVFNTQDYSLIIGMQAGANWQLGNLKAVTAEKMSLAVDWVRVWQK